MVVVGHPGRVGNKAGPVGRVHAPVARVDEVLWPPLPPQEARGGGAGGPGVEGDPHLLAQVLDIDVAPVAQGVTEEQGRAVSGDGPGPLFG